MDGLKVYSQYLENIRESVSNYRLPELKNTNIVSIMGRMRQIEDLSYIEQALRLCENRFQNEKFVHFSWKSTLIVQKAKDILYFERDMVLFVPLNIAISFIEPAPSKYLEKNKIRELLLFLISINTGVKLADLLKLKVCDIKNKDLLVATESATGKKKVFPLKSEIKELAKKFLSIPILFVKQNKQNYRKYDLFNCITVWKEFNAEGFDEN